MELQLKYFVLKPKGGDPFALASRRAMLTYADEIKTTEPDLAAELRQWVRIEEERLDEGGGE